ncbi:hypothetical protein EHQ12_15485 [Leptospira gomenensis]|uniref:Uncharacterized protein n=1 Tax=Leptospira gomenensis TaxID=2484974 RepID=A0A5F1YCQ2_9LEPT|nr:hypothetical protein EHQ12_15485 [Leptospira gomenensis]TGK35340.1 hypothetical protein EHQ17_07740 [Leptospira gomenensis]TGK51817.1 hypothetical protein EHQ07_02240 [Leptospira gomenensis]TGK58410.1 hypothetical protein EHQ13_14145 [Leptospira gomenensis]
MIQHRVQVKKVNQLRFSSFYRFRKKTDRSVVKYFASASLSVRIATFVSLFWIGVGAFDSLSADSGIKTELYRYNKLTLQYHPVRNPRSLPIEFVPEGSELLYSTELKSERGYFDTRESFLLFTHSFQKKQMEVYYTSIFQSLFWRVLQEENEDHKTVIMAESQNKKVVTIQIEATPEGSRVKLFYKKSGN